MNNEFNKFNEGKRQLTSIGLTPAEKATIWARLELSFPDLRVMPKPVFGLFSYFRPRVVAVVAVIIAILTTTGGTLWAAEKSLPGQWLYSVKVKVNEPLQSIITVRDSSRAVWETEKITRRISEAEALAERGELDDAKREELETQVVQHAEAYQAITKKLEQEIEVESEVSHKQESTEKLEEIQGRFQERIAERTEALEVIKEKIEDEEQKEQIDRLEIKIKEKVNQPQNLKLDSPSDNVGNNDNAASSNNAGGSRGQGQARGKSER